MVIRNLIVLAAFIISASSTAQACRQSALQRSRTLIEAMLKDLSKVYPHAGGGGISKITQVRTDTYKVSILQEKKVDEYIYEMTTGTNCHVEIKSRKESVQSKGGSRVSGSAKRTGS